MPIVEFYREVLDHMSSGVMTLQMDGKILTCNPAAGSMLGIAAASVVGRMFGDVFLVEMEGNDEFTQLILDAVYESGRSHEKVVPFVRADGSTVWLSLKTAALAEGVTQAVIISFSDVTQIELLREAEQDLNARLQKAYRELEGANQSLQQAMGRSRVIRRVAMVFGVLLLAVVGGWLWFGDFTAGWSKDGVTALADANALNTAPVVREPVEHLITLSGKIKPLEMINLVSPFEGRILASYVKSGQTVAGGDLLLELDSMDLDAKMRDQKAAYIKARQNFDELSSWSNSVEMSQSRRRLVRAQNNLSQAEKKLKDAEYLFEKGIVSANELQDAKDGIDNYRMEVLSAREEVASTSKKGCAANLEVAQIELHNAQRRYELSQEKLKQSKVYAPVSGVVLEAKQMQKERPLPARGSVVGENELLLAIGNMEGLTVSSKIDEVDVGHLSTGMPVRITGDAFPETELEGIVAAVSSEARSEGGHSATFDVEVVVPQIDKALLDKLRLGMSSTLDVQVYSRESALTVPVYAVAFDGESHVVQVARASGDLELRPVVVGVTTLNAVEILDGLQEGEQVVVP